jgi:hypothetical protein
VRMRLWPGLLASSLLAVSLPGVAAADGHIEVLEDVATVVVVRDPATTPDFPVGSLSRADCAVLVRIVAEDGSSEEFQSCTLSDEPVMIPENQGTAPEATVTDAGGECIWSSDYHYTVDESDVKASAFEVTITPSGRVSAWSSYPAEPLDCPEEE